MIDVDRNSILWNYLSSGQKGLIEVGFHLLEDVRIHPDVRITDYSYLVFPFAKAYEGFLKKVFLDAGFITQSEYESERFRIGRALNPSLDKFLRQQSTYDKIVGKCGNRDIADRLWSVWKKGRNLVFHYFPHNLKSLTLAEAEQIIQNMLSVMEQSLILCEVKKLRVSRSQ